MATTIPTSDVGPFSHPLKNIHIPPTEPEPTTACNEEFTPNTRQILDKWAARQARDMITSIERRANQAELSALCTKTRPVAARAATFMRESPPSETSSESSMNLDVGPNVRARNLIQMWREMEAEAGSPMTPGRGEQEKKVMAREGSGKFGSDKGGSSLVRVRCRREMEDLVERMMKEREKEVSGLAELGKVSRFSHRGRIQSMLRLRFLRKDLPFQNETLPLVRRNRNKSLESLKSGVTILFLKERFNNQNKTTNNKIALNKDEPKAQVPIVSQDSCTSQQENQLIDNNEHQEVISIEDRESLPPETTSPQSICEENIVNQDELSPRCPSPGLESVHSDHSEKSESPSLKLEESWEERNVWTSNIDWNRNEESPSTQNWQSDSEVVTEETEPYTPNEIVGAGHDWMNNSYITWRGWGENSQEYYDYFETFSDNVEIRELLQRRRVTTSLQSDFCHTMNKMIMSFLDKQEQEYADENFGEDYGENQNWNRGYEFNNKNQISSDSSLVPFSCTAVNYTNDWQLTAPFTRCSSHDLQEMENEDDMKNEMGKMREEIRELKKMLKSCMEWQSKIQDTIKYEVSFAIRQQVSIAKSSENFHMPSREKSCCICHEMKVDSLLYRCGHMCTCFKCADELHWRKGTCPICDAAIEDVVRAHPDT